MTPTEIYAAWGELSIYTNAESCPMCASAIRWSGFKEYIYGTTIQHNYNVGWGVITLPSYDVFQQSRQLPGYQTIMLGQILTNETDPLFSWQYNEVSEPKATAVSERRGAGGSAPIGENTRWSAKLTGCVVLSLSERLY